MLNHLYALSIRDGVMVLSATHRYRKKYVTTLLYKPINWTPNTERWSDLICSAAAGARARGASDFPEPEPEPEAFEIDLASACFCNVRVHINYSISVGILY